MTATAKILHQLTGFNIAEEYKFHPSRKWRFDFAIVDKKIAIEVEGGIWEYGRHNRAAGFLGDMEKYNEAAALGWRLLRFTPKELLTVKSIELIKKTANYERIN